jgi:hypothetical protein
MNAVMTGPDIPAMTLERRCQIDEVFASPFIELIGLAPRNPVVRGLILAQTGKMPGAERQTFEQIKEWVETTCEKKMRQTNSSRTPSRDGISVVVEFSETECGRAHYSVDRSGSAEFALDADELLEMVQQAIDSEDGLDQVVEKIAEKIDEDAWNRCDPNLDNYGDYDYSDHDSNDSGNSTTEFSRTQIRDRLLVFLRERHPDLLEELT